MSSSPRQRERYLALSYSRQRVISAHQNRLAVTCMISRSRSNAVKSPGPASHVVRGIGVIYPAELRLANLIEFLWQKLLVSLVRFRVRWWVQIQRRLFDRHDVQRSYKRPRGWARPGKQVRTDTVGRTKKFQQLRTLGRRRIAGNQACPSRG